ncbi:MAG: DNA internalization-related competence protein ComEC/Rec2 [Burkholderiales bacterium]|nr:DNA internalization-related competence protein ComEC/Rec2 [Burkholderiales bacterium]
MRSRLGVVLAAWAAGACALQASPRLLPMAALVMLGALTMLALAWRADGWRGALLVALAAFVLGAAYASWRAEVRLADALDPAWEGAVVVVTGVIDELPAASERGTRFAFAVESVIPAAARVPTRLSLAWFPGIDDDDDAGVVPLLRAGERWRLRVRLKRPHGTVNPGGFDLEAWLLQRDLRATGYVVRAADNDRLADFAGRPRDVVQRAREAIRERLLRDLGGARYAGVVVALAIGEQRAITEAQWVVFNRTGVGHLVSISGLHVTVFASLAGALAYALARRSVRLTAAVPARKLALGVGVACAAAYTLLAGAEIPAVRTFAMLAIAAIGLWSGRSGTAGIVWLWALAGVLAWDPWAPLTPGFWLSYGAVALLLYAAAGRLGAEPAAAWHGRIIAAVREGTHAQWVVTVGLAPLTLALFAQTSLVAPLANAVAIPVVTLGVVPLALLAIVVPSPWLPIASHAVLVPLMSCLEWLARAPEAAWQQHAPAGWAVVVGIAGVLWLLAPRGVPGRALATLWLLPLVFARSPPLPADAFRLTVLDVGQGLAAVIETREHTLVYDAGPGFNEVADAGGRIVVPFLRAVGRPRADAIVISHQDLDHAGGALSLMRAVPFVSLVSSLAPDHPIVTHAAATHDTVRCRAGQGWTWDGVRFTILHPTRDEYDDPRATTNDRSCVLRIDAVGGSALLVGDIEALSEARLVRKWRAALPADVLVVPHHGSRTSSSLPFVRAVAPSWAIVTSGYRNRFGHPKPDVVARYTGRGATVLRTDRAGAITMTFAAGAPLAVSEARVERARYWHEATGD